MMLSQHQVSEQLEKNFLQLKRLNHEKILLNLYVCRFGTGLSMIKKQLHTECKSLAKNTLPGWRTFCLTPSTLWKSEPAIAQGVDLPVIWLRPSPRKHVSLNICILYLSKTPNWFSDDAGIFERKLLPSSLSTFGFQF